MSARPTVGVLGGLGPAATVDFMARLIAATPAPSDQDHLRLLVDHNPAVPNRHDAIAGRSAKADDTSAEADEEEAAEEEGGEEKED